MRVEWRDSTPRLASKPERRNENKHLNKYFFPRVGIELNILLELIDKLNIYQYNRTLGTENYDAIFVYMSESLCTLISETIKLFIKFPFYIKYLFSDFL